VGRSPEDQISWSQIKILLIYFYCYYGKDICNAKRYICYNGVSVAITPSPHTFDQNRLDGITLQLPQYIIRIYTEIRIVIYIKGTTNIFDFW